ncbi:hypothetical protein NHH03_07705 [Stieleria sp. TO1_6]|uniref:lipopolysaccharide biosynthesis protein n=1 Tax=Stieleria tagensis TaxID=2956795 RepID=UPI00209B2F06|nr:hypothetical protein [Stieleria tagensis]MCO8121617.1 hypothetical protein [Stieleria tagensis]
MSELTTRQPVSQLFSKAKVDKRRLASNMAPLIIKSTGLGGAISFPLLLVYFYGIHDAGVIQFFLSTTIMLASFIRLGWDHVLFRAGCNDDRQIQTQYLISAVSQTLLLGIGILIAYYLTVYYTVNPSHQMIAWLSGLALIPLAVSWQVGEFQKGRGSTIQWALLNNTGFQLVGVALLVPIALIQPGRPLVATIAVVIAAWLVAILAIHRVYQDLQPDDSQQCLTSDTSLCSMTDTQRIGLREVFSTSKLKESLHLAPLSFSSSAQSWLDVTVVGLIGSPEAVTLIRLAGRFSFVPGFLNSIVVASLVPKLAQSIRENKTQATATLWQKTARIPLALGLMSTVVVLVAVWVGRDWLADRGLALLFPLIAILSAGHLIAVATGAVGYILLTCHQDHTLKRLSLLGLPIAAILQFALVLVFGAIGSAIATALYLASYNLILRRFAHLALNQMNGSEPNTSTPA